MKYPRLTTVTFLTVLGLSVFTGADWLRFRGPNGSGLAADNELPTRFSEDQNVAWKISLPGRGLSGPIVIGDRVVITSCTGFRQDRLHVVCYSAATGEEIWHRQLWATGRTMTHPSISTAAPTPASDGERIVAYFSSSDLACFDMDGNLQWVRGLMLDYPNASNSLGMASSPLIIGDTVVLPIETDSQSVALGLDLSNGANRWELERPMKASWTSPILIQDEDSERPIVILQSGPHMTAHDAHTGDEIWRYDKGCSTVPSSVLDQGRLYIPSNGLTALTALDSQAGPQVLWQSNRLAASTATPLVFEGKIFSISGSILKCGDAETGQQLWQTRLGGNFTSSPIVAGGRLYVFNEDGQVHVVEAGDRRAKAQVAGELGEKVLCSPAVADNALYVRTDQSLWKIADTENAGG